VTEAARISSSVISALSGRFGLAMILDSSVRCGGSLKFRIRPHVGDGSRPFRDQVLGVLDPINALTAAQGSNSSVARNAQRSWSCVAPPLGGG
jgi:hypothetical protein